MNKLLPTTLLCTAALLAPLAGQAETVPAALAGIAPLEYQVQLDNAESEFFTVEVAGTSYERGYQHGEALRKVIRPALLRFKHDMVESMLTQLGSEQNWNDYKRFFFEHTGLYQNALVQAPDLVDEIRGIADGAGVEFEELFVYNLNFDETFWVLEKMTGIDPLLAMEQAELALPDGHCSHASVWADGRASVAYTLDWTRHFEGTQALIKHQMPNGDLIMMTTYAGTLIGHGVNISQGYTFTPHSKFQLAHDVDNGLAQIVIYRKLIEAGSVDKAIQVLKWVKPAAGLGYALTDRHGTRTFEVSANRIEEFSTGENWMAIANVARANADLSKSYRQALNLEGDIDMEQLPERYWQLNHDSVERFELIKQKIAGKKPAELSAQDWNRLFEQKPLNKAPGAKLATTNLWHRVEIDDQYITYGSPPATPVICHWRSTL